MGFTAYSGQYKGMSYLDSATGAHLSLLSAITSIEDTLSEGFSTPCPYPYPGDPTPTPTSAAAQRSGTLNLSEEALFRLAKISEANQFTEGLDTELEVRTSQYLIEQTIYSRELSADRINRNTR